MLTHDKKRIALMVVLGFAFVVCARTPANAVCGDVSGDGFIRSNDLLLLARACMGTHTISTADMLRADVSVAGSRDGLILSDDLLSVTRAAFGTVELGCGETPVCGNGNVDSGEQCDDSNTVSDDGCSSSCQNDSKFANAWITVPAGSFVMGHATADTNYMDDEYPKHTVTLKAYRIQKYEVTNTQYWTCVTVGSCAAPSSSSSKTVTAYYGNAAYGDYPVIYITWSQALAYCQWIGGRLPTEAEWEKAARGPSPREPVFPWGNSLPTCSQANGTLNYTACVGDTAPVGSYPAGASYYGMLDMAGNVWEWTNDWYALGYYQTSPSTDPQGPTTGIFRVGRGGSWYYSEGFMRTSFRLDNDPTNKSNGMGIRCAKDF